MGRGTPRPDSTPRRVVRLVCALGLLVALLSIGLAVGATDETDGGETDAGGGGGTDVDVEQLQFGQDVYLQNCSGCHQPSGSGVPGSFPPLAGNPNVDDTEYVRGVIANGLSGVIEVNGETYDGVMPSFSTLSDEEVDALIAFLRNDLTVPGEPAEGGAGAVPAGPSLPPVAVGMASLAYLMAFAIGGVVLAPRVVSVVDRRHMSPLDAALRSGLIVVYFIVGTVVIPALVLESEVVSRVPQPVQDIVASGLWLGALAIGLVGLWWFQRQDRI